MTEITITLFEQELIQIIQVLNQLPTGTGAYPLVQKLAAQLPEAEKTPEK